jgi:hypothetical protein
VTLALQGYPAEYIAEALDHLSTSTVKHYVRYTYEFSAYIDALTTQSSEVVAAVRAWEGKMVDQRQMQDSPHVGRPIGSLGICMKDAACDYWPTVSCYSCSRFRPSREADHREAARHIADEQRRLQPFPASMTTHMFDRAIATANALAGALEQGALDESD